MPFLVCLRQAEVGLGINRVVVAPVRYRAASETRFEIVARFEHGVQRHVAAIAPPPNPDATRIDVWQRLEILRAVTLVGKFLRAHAEMQRRFESMPTPRPTPLLPPKNNLPPSPHNL